MFTIYQHFIASNGDADTPSHVLAERATLKSAQAFLAKLHKAISGTRYGVAGPTVAHTSSDGLTYVLNVPASPDYALVHAISER